MLSVFEKNNILDRFSWSSDSATTQLFDSLVTVLDNRYKRVRQKVPTKTCFTMNSYAIELEYTKDRSLSILIQYRK